MILQRIFSLILFESNSLRVAIASLMGVLYFTATAAAQEYMVGADLSFLRDVESQGVKFEDAGVIKPGLQIFREHGYNWIRLRIFHTPSAHRDRLPNDLQYTAACAQEAKKLGYHFLLCFHYSDSWADPGKQWCPASWKDLTKEETVAAVESYTRDVLIQLAKGDVFPDMVQIGNEISAGMVWPVGRLYNGAPDQNFATLCELIRGGIRGVDQSLVEFPSARRPQIMIHIDKGGDRPATKYFFDRIAQQGVKFDVIGQSYYPFWHGSLLELRDNLQFMAKEYQKDIVLVEVAYNWRSTMGNEGYGGRSAPFPESPEGQRAFLEEVHRIVLAVPDGKGRGLFWWEPAVRPGGISRRSLFDDQSKALPAIQVFDRWTIGRLK